MDRARVVAAVGTCHLVDDPGTWPPRSDASREIFNDEDLGITSVACLCGIRYLWVRRRVPGGMWNFLIPVAPPEIDVLIARIADALQTKRDRWKVAEDEIVRLTSMRPFVERTDDSPAVLGWRDPGTPLAFTIAPW